MRKVRENIIATCGDLPFFGKDAPECVFNCGTSGCFGPGATVNVLPGQGVIYDPVSLMTITPGSTVDDFDRIVIGVGVDLTGNGISDAIRKNFGDTLFGCHIKAATSEGPACGVPPIQDLLFKCTYCDEAYSITITVQNDQTEHEFPYNKDACYTFTVFTECCKCDDCKPEHNCQELACKFVSKINGCDYDKSKDNPAFLKHATPNKGLPFWATRLFEKSSMYCIDAVETDCDKCNHVGAITTATVDGEVIEFKNNLNPVTGLTLQGQLGNIIDQVNAKLQGKGSVILTKGAGKCCPFQLHVNSCVEVVFPELEVCEEWNPFDPIPGESCDQCTEPTDNTFQCGIRIIGKPVDYPCGCYPTLVGPSWLSSKLEIAGLDGFSCGGWHKREVQKSEPPQNLGFDWQHREAMSDCGGHGRGQNGWITNRGPVGLPDGTGRVSNLHVKCADSYCSYILEHGIPNSNNGVSAPYREARGRTVILIPAGDATTIQSFEDCINPYITSAGCPIKCSITCATEYPLLDKLGEPLLDSEGNPVDPATTTDQDQIEGQYTDSTTGKVKGKYPDSNGYRY